MDLNKTGLRVERELDFEKGRRWLDIDASVKTGLKTSLFTMNSRKHAPKLERELDLEERLLVLLVRLVLLAAGTSTNTSSLKLASQQDVCATVSYSSCCCHSSGGQLYQIESEITKEYHI